MTTTILRVNLVLSIRDTRVETDRCGAWLCPDPDMLRDLAFYQSRQLPASLVFDTKAQQISAVGSAPIDRLLALPPAAMAGDQLSVQLMKRPTLLYLSKVNPRFDELYRLLANAVSEKKRVALGVLPAGNRVEDVRVDDWQG